MTKMAPASKGPPKRKPALTRRQRWLRFIAIAAAALLLGPLLLLGAIELAIWWASDQVPPILDNQSFQDVVPQTSRVYAGDGTLLNEYYIERRTVVPMEAISPFLVQAVTAVEDKQFQEHGGVSPVTIVKALIADALAGRMVRGGSTLTQQLAKNLYLSHEKTLLRKVKEAAIASQMEARLSKEQILWQYLNLIYWGHGNFGVQEAARFYFGVDASKLDLVQSALLAGIIRSPERLSPVKYPDKAATRLYVALHEMGELGFLPEGQHTFEMPAVVGKRDVSPELSPYGVDAALVQLKPVIDSDLLLAGGFRIQTTLDTEVQNALNDSLAAVMPHLDISSTWRDTPPASLCDCQKAGRILPGCSAWAQVVRLEEDGRLTVDLLGVPATIPADSLAPPPLDPGWSTEMRPGRWIRVMPTHEVLAANPWVSEDVTAIPVLEPQVAAVVVEAASGNLLGVLGGVDFVYHPFNRALPSPTRITPADVAYSLLQAGPGAAAQPSLGILSQVLDRWGNVVAFPPLLALPPSARGLHMPQTLDAGNWFVATPSGLVVVVWCGELSSDCPSKVGQELLHRLERLNDYIPQGNGPK